MNIHSGRFSRQIPFHGYTGMSIYIDLSIWPHSRRSTSKKQIPTPMCRWWPSPGGVFLLPIIIKSMTHALRILEFRNSHFLEFWKHTFPPPFTVFFVPSKFLCACSQHHTTHCHHHHRQDGRRWLKLEGDGKTTKGQDSLLSGVAFIKRTPSESAPLSLTLAFSVIINALPVATRIQY
jgi:hypothetical protein